MKPSIIAFFSCMLISVTVLADSWHIEGVDISSNNQFRAPSIAIEAGDIVHIAYQQQIYDDSSHLKYAYQSGTNWSISIVESNISSHYMAEYPSLALDNSGDPCIAYADDASGGVLKYAAWTGSYWDIGIVDSGIGYSGQVSLCLDDGNNPPSIAFSCGPGTDHDLMYARFDTNWYVSPVDIPERLGYFLSMDLASDNTPHISYHDATNGNLKYVYLGPEFWYKFTIDSGGDVGSYSSLAIDSNDRPHISYEDNSNMDLKYAYYTGSSYVIQTVDSYGNVGHYCTSIALDSNDNPHISYYDLTNNHLKYAHHNGSTWEISIVDSDEYAGMQSSIAIDSNDQPHIAYSASDGGYYLIRHAFYGPEGIEEGEYSSNQDGLISQNVFPNPCIGSASVSFNLPVSNHVNLALYDVTGRKIAILTEETFSAGIHELEISDLTSGVYFCSLQVGNFVDTKALVVIE